MSRIAYVNGRYQRLSEASVHVEDRGNQFSDGVYEVWSIYDGHIFDEAGHFERLKRSLRELRIGPVPSTQVLRRLVREVARRNRVENGIVYLQISRGVAPRNHPFPKEATPTVILTARRANRSKLDALARRGAKIITRPDDRWARPDIKAISLLPNVLAKQAAADADADEAWFVDRDGFVTEGSSTNAWIIDADGRLRTRQADNDILNGITRRAVIEVAAGLGLEVVEKPFTVDEAKAAREAFYTSATSFVTPVVYVDDRPIGNAAPGEISEKLRASYIEHALSKSSKDLH